MKKLRFKNKTYGYGRVPATWQGRVIIAVYVIVLAALGLSLDENSPMREVAFMFILPCILLTIALLRIAYKTGEKPERRWGKKDVNNKN